MRKFIAGLLIGVFAFGCAGTLTQDPVLVTGKSLVSLNKRVNDAHDQYVQLCGQAILAKVTCEAWAEFHKEFKLHYPPAYDAWKLASTGVGQPGDLQSIERVITLLSDKAAMFLVIQLAQKKK